jgi:hypothetical protein
VVLFIDGIDRIEVAQRGGGHDHKPHDGTARSCIVPFIDQSEYLSSLIDDPRLDGIFVSLMGGDYNYIGSDGNFYVGGFVARRGSFPWWGLEKT